MNYIIILEKTDKNIWKYLNAANMISLNYEEDKSDEFYEAIADHMCNLTDTVLYNTSFGISQPDDK